MQSKRECKDSAAVTFARKTLLMDVWNSVKPRPATDVRYVFQVFDRATGFKIHRPQTFPNKMHQRNLKPPDGCKKQKEDDTKFSDIEFDIRTLRKIIHHAGFSAEITKDRRETIVKSIKFLQKEAYSRRLLTIEGKSQSTPDKLFAVTKKGTLLRRNTV